MSNLLQPNQPMRPFIPRELSSRYVLDNVIGRGFSGKVSKVFDKHTNKCVAIKRIYINPSTQKLLTERTVSSLPNEIDNLKKIRHNNLVAIYDYYIFGIFFYVVLEYCSAGTLQQFLSQSPNTRVSEITSKYLINQVIDGLMYLNRFNIIHGDLKPKNILLDRGTNSSNTHNLVVKISNWGRTKNNIIEKTFYRDSYYTPPELRNEQINTFIQKADLWSLGLIIYEMVNGSYLFDFVNNVDMPLTFTTTVSRDCSNLIRSLVQLDPIKRISLSETSYHIWLNRPNSKVLDKSFIAINPDYDYEPTNTRR